ncbi:MAG: hypothetical protein ACTHJT_01070, partial [Cytophaga sp.]|uniref:hypothetical protein n=1 Tax=Cytophaga sp. TaxID=29535 RepID=UPI003F7F193A
MNSKKDYYTILGKTIPENIKPVLDELFKDNSHPLSITNRTNFDKYFALNLSPNDISNSEISSIWAYEKDKLNEELILLNLRNSSALASKMKLYFDSKAVITEQEFEAYFDALLNFYEYIIFNRNEEALLYGVNTDNLGFLILKLAKSVKWSSEESWKKILEKDRVSFIGLFDLFNVNRISFYYDN